MQFIKRHPYYQLIRITGPAHNLLGLELTREPSLRGPDVEALGASDLKPDDDLPRRIVEEVAQGVAQACREVGVNYHVRKVRYVVNDSPPLSIYRQLAAEIVRRVDRDGGFEAAAKVPADDDNR